MHARQHLTLLSQYHLPGCRVQVMPYDQALWEAVAPSPNVTGTGSVREAVQLQ